MTYLLSRGAYDRMVQSVAPRTAAMRGTNLIVRVIQAGSTGTFMNINPNLNACGYLAGPLDRSGSTAGNSDPGRTQFSGPLGRQQHR